MATCPKCRAHYDEDVDICEVDGERLLPDEACAGFEADLQAGDLVGEYRIEHKIGEGTFGAVYGAVHPVIGKAAAVKVLRRQFSSDPTVVSRFVAEARAVNQIRHRNIIDIFSFGTLEGGLQYFVMEWLDGVALDEYLAEHGPLPPEVAIPLLRDIGRALSAAHSAGIAHRDLKPENVFLCFDDEDAVYPKLLDFGIAKLLGDAAVQHKTRTGVAMGTPLYMSPEQCRGHGVDHRADIYSFGAMTHEVLTGHPPFDADNVMDLMMKQTAALAPPMSSVRGDLPPQLDAPVLHMLEKDSADRPQTIREAIDELMQAARAAGIEAAGPLSGAGLAAVVRSAGDSATPLARVVTGSDGRAARSLELARTAPTDPDAAPARTADRPATEVVVSETGGSGTLSNVEADIRAMDGPAAPGRGKAVGLLVAAAVLVAGVALTVALTRSRPTVESSPGASTEPAIAPSAAASSAPAPPLPSATTASPRADVSLTLESSIANIDVLLDDTKIGTSPGPIPLPYGTERIELTLVKRGYVPKKVTVIPDRDITQSVELDRIPTAATTSTPTSGDTAEIAFPPGFEDSP